MTVARQDWLLIYVDYFQLEVSVQLGFAKLPCAQNRPTRTLRRTWLGLRPIFFMEYSVRPSVSRSREPVLIVTAKLRRGGEGSFPFREYPWPTG